jgi:hypothetical protein
MNMVEGLFLNGVVGLGFVLGAVLFLSIAVAVIWVTIMELKESLKKRAAA